MLKGKFANKTLLLILLRKAKKNKSYIIEHFWNFLEVSEIAKKRFKIFFLVFHASNDLLLILVSHENVFIRESIANLKIFL